MRLSYLRAASQHSSAFLCQASTSFEALGLHSHCGIVEFLPGKRAFAIGLCVYHSTVSTVLFNSPRFIPYSLGPLAESYVLLSVINSVLRLAPILQI